MRARNKELQASEVLINKHNLDNGHRKLPKNDNERVKKILDSVRVKENYCDRAKRVKFYQ